VPPTVGLAGGVELKVMAWGGSTGAGADPAGADADTSATTPVTAPNPDGHAPQPVVDVAPGEDTTSVAMAVSELSIVKSEAPLGAENNINGVPTPSTSRSPASVVVTLGGASPLTELAASMGCVGLIPLNASVIMATCVAELRVAFAIGVELPTTYVHAASWVLEPFAVS